jgi:transposase
VPVCNRIEQEELGCGIQHAAVRQHRPADAERLQLARVARTDRSGTGACAPGTGALHRLLEAHGVCNYVINPTSLRVSRQAKTDWIAQTANTTM